MARNNDMQYWQPSTPLHEVLNRKQGLKWKSGSYWQSAGYNARLFQMFQTQILDMALTRYRWVNLPDTCDERFLELTLLFQGIATVAKPYSGEHADEWLSLQVGGWKDKPDIYGNPSRWSALGVNGYSFNVTPDNGFYAWENHLRTPIQDRIDLWARELVDIIRTMQQNRVHQKLPLIIFGPQEKKLDLTNYVKQVGGGEVMILASDGIQNLQATTLTPPNATPFIGEQLFSNYQNVWNQIYAGLGIGNLPFKAERRIEDEVTSQTDPTDLIALDGLTCRRRMCDYLNAHFAEFEEKPLNVVWRQDNETANYNTLHNLEELLALDDETATPETSEVTL